MALFRRRQQGSSQADSTGRLAVDPAAGDELGRRLWRELEAGRWEEAHGALEAAGAFDREFLVDLIAGFPGRPVWLDEWVRERPSSAVPVLVRGAHGVRWAWEARGGGRAETVAADMWEVFFARLNAAEDDLMEAVRRDAKDPTPWTNLLVSGRGLQLSLEEICLRFDQVTARERWLPFAHDQMLQGLCAKWYGSSELMFKFARETTADAPDGASVHKIVALAHIEQWIEQERPPAYFRTPAVLAEIVEAAGRSVFSPSFGSEKQDGYARNMFALAFHLAGDRQHAARLFDQIGELVTEFPW